ncbi:MAG TPA: lactonase family protein [Verrucomicrobiota bacterium]|mgnify:FL=1|nr:lactonase family protein [Verrucomicrobiota bacterium]
MPACAAPRRIPARLVLLACLAGWTASAAEHWAFIGTYTGGRSKGIHVSRHHDVAGTLTEPRLVAEARNPSFLAARADGRALYAVNETGDFEGRPAGSVSAFRLDPATGELTLLNQASTGGGGPCHLTLDRAGRHLFVANYGGGSVAVNALEPGGQIGRQTAFVQHTGSSVNAARQQAPHAHGIYLDDAERHVLVPDLGLDQVVIYRFDAATGGLSPSPAGNAKLAPGAGPRHLAFSADGRHFFVLNELLSTVTVFSWDAAAGQAGEGVTVSTLPAGFTGGNSTAEIEAHPDGRSVYASNRGHDSLVVFRWAEARLAPVQHHRLGVKTPRHFALSPSGRWLLVSGQNSDRIEIHAVNTATGTLAETGRSVEVGAPVCVVFVPVAP